MKVFYKDGSVNHLTTFNQGNPEGKIVSYHENGQILAEGVYKNGKLEGDYLRYFASGESLKTVSKWESCILKETSLQ